MPGEWTNDTPKIDKQRQTSNIVITNNKKEVNIMEDHDETLGSAIAEAEYCSTGTNAIYGAGITGVATEETFTPEQIARYGLPKYMAWNTGERAQYDVSDHEYIGFGTLQAMADYINEESPLIEGEE